VAALGTLGVFALQGPRVRGAGLGGVFDHLPDVSGTRFGQSLLVRLVLLVLAVAPTWSAGQAHTARWRFAAGFVGVALLATFGAGGHPAAQPLPVLGVALDTAHLGAAAAWIGGLVVLAVAHRTWLDGEPMGTTPAAALRRFSLVAMVAVLVVVATGAAQALRLLEAFDLLGTTDWGRTLLVKVSAVTLLVTVGATTGYALRRHGPASLRAAVVAEAAIGLAVVGLSAGLVTGSPHGASTGLTPSVVRAVEGDVAVTLTVTPAQVGVNELHLLVALPVTATEPSQSASVRFSLPERGIDGLAVALAPEGPDHYSAYGVQLPYAGTWTVAVTVGVAGGDEVVVQTVVVIADG
jgi:copper transport protein